MESVKEGNDLAVACGLKGARQRDTYGISTTDCLRQLGIGNRR